jgi:hypothetical protein
LLPPEPVVPPPAVEPPLLAVVPPADVAPPIALVPPELDAPPELDVPPELGSPPALDAPPEVVLPPELDAPPEVVLPPWDVAPAPVLPPVSFDDPPVALVEPPSLWPVLLSLPHAVRPTVEDAPVTTITRNSLSTLIVRGVYTHSSTARDRANGRILMFAPRESVTKEPK